MFEILKNAKLLILPAWVCDALEAHEMKPADIVTMEGLESILSPTDVRFYQSQINAVIEASASDSISPEANPVGSLFASVSPLHTNYAVPRVGGSMETPTVKINTLYGKTIVAYNFFPKLDMSGYIPRSMISMVDSTVTVHPYLEFASADLFVLKFSTGFYNESFISNGYPEPAKQFVKNTLDLLMGNYGFDQVRRTNLFELYTLLPYEV